MFTSVIISTVIIFILTSILAAFMTYDYFRKKKTSIIFWSLGLWAFVIGVILEVFFSVGIYSQDLIKSYLFVVALVVEALAIGSVLLLGRRHLTEAYSIYVIITSAALIYVLIVASIGNIIKNGVVFGLLPLYVTLFSAFITFPAAVALIVISLYSYKKTRNVKMISIISGVIVVTVAGTLYIAAFPAFLYYSEFIGILLLWAGFFNFKEFLKKPSMEVKKNVSD